MEPRHTYREQTATHLALLDRASDVAVLYVKGPAASTAGFSIEVPGPVSLAQIGHISIKTVSPLATNTKLMVNGAVVSKDSVGSTTRDGIQDKLILEYISVEISTGINVIELVNEVNGRTVANGRSAQSRPSR